MIRHWVVEFAGCSECVIRSGESLEDVNEPDDLGCPVARIRLLDEVPLPRYWNLWEKNGELRCDPVP